MVFQLMFETCQLFLDFAIQLNKLIILNYFCIIIPISNRSININKNLAKVIIFMIKIKIEINNN
jgi:hypothetical protein